MNEANENLEAELAALRPHDATPELRRRIADHRAHSRPPGSRWRWAVALASGVAAACVVAVFLRWEVGREVKPQPTSSVTSPSPRHPSPLWTRCPRSWRIGRPGPLTRRPGCLARQGSCGHPGIQP